MIEFMIEKRQLCDIKVPHCGQFSSICRFITNLTKSKRSKVRPVPVSYYPLHHVSVIPNLLMFKLQMPNGIYMLHILNFAGIITEKEMKCLFTKVPNIWIRILGWYVVVKHQTIMAK